MPSSQPAAGHLAIKPEYQSSQPSAAAKKSEPNRSQSYRPNKPHITDSPITQGWSSYIHALWYNKLTTTFSQLVQACQLAQRLLDHWDPTHRPRHRLLDTLVLANCGLECHLLLRYGIGNHCWLPQAMCVWPPPSHY